MSKIIDLQFTQFFLTKVAHVVSELILVSDQEQSLTERM